MSPEDHILDLLPAYALGSLQEAEKVQVSEHLAGCEACRLEFSAYRQVAEQLPLALADYEPPADLKLRLMKRVRSSSNGLPDAKPRQQRWRSTLQGLAPAWGLVSLVLLVGLVASNVWLVERLNRLEKTSGYQIVALTGTSTAPEASGILIMSREGGAGTLIVDDLPALDDEHQYQLWLIRDGERTSGGVFSVRGVDGDGYLGISSVEPLNQFDSFGVTIEPAGGSSEPTGERVLGNE